MMRCSCLIVLLVSLSGVPAFAQTIPGLEVLVTEQRSLIAGKRVGLITNHSGVDRQMNHAIDLIGLRGRERRLGELIREATLDLENIEIRMFRGLAVEFVKECGARVMIRGVRPITDMAAELTMMMANRRLAPDVETLFMIADGDLAHVSSSLIKQIAPLADDRALARFLPPGAVRAVRAKVGAVRT